MTPQIPHTKLSSLRPREESTAGMEEEAAQMNPGHVQAAVGIPAQEEAQGQQEDHGKNGKKQHGKRFAFQNHAPVYQFLPARGDEIQDAAQVQSEQGEAGETDVGKALASAAMNLAAELGEARVSADVVRRV